MKFKALMILLMIYAPASAQLQSTLDSIIRSYVGDMQPGIALLVQAEGKTLYKKGFGMADPGKGTLITSQTNFRMASVSKQFTATSIALLEKQGKLTFDDPIGNFLPGLPAQIRQIPVRNLLTHTSGIIDYEELMADSSDRQILDQDVLKLLEKENRTYFEPGSQFRYSNSAYALLALITEQASGQSFPAFVKKNIFRPLKMSKSMVYESDKTIKNRAMGYARDKAAKLFPNDQSSTSAVKGDGGVYTSLDDYQKWLSALQTNKLIDLRQLLKDLNHPIKNSTGSHYGPGWFYFDQSRPGLFHSGSTCGFSTFSIYFPDSQTSLVYFSNIANNSVPFKRILEHLQKDGFADPARIFELHELTR